MELGVGSARSEKHGLIVVARYSPMGSTGGPSSFIENVGPTSKFYIKASLCSPLCCLKHGKAMFPIHRHEMAQSCLLFGPEPAVSCCGRASRPPVSLDL